MHGGVAVAHSASKEQHHVPFGHGQEGAAREVEETHRVVDAQVVLHFENPG